MKIYVAGPYTKGDTILNIRAAVYAGNYIAYLGHTPFIPHLTAFWHMLIPHDDINFWYNYDNEWLKACDALLRLEGESTGSDAEVKLAQSLGMTIYRNLFDIPKAE